MRGDSKSHDSIPFSRSALGRNVSTAALTASSVAVECTEVNTLGNSIEALLWLHHWRFQRVVHGHIAYLRNSSGVRAEVRSGGTTLRRLTRRCMLLCHLSTCNSTGQTSADVAWSSADAFVRLLTTVQLGCLTRLCTRCSC